MLTLPEVLALMTIRGLFAELVLCIVNVVESMVVLPVAAVFVKLKAALGVDMPVLLIVGPPVIAKLVIAVNVLFSEIVPLSVIVPPLKFSPAITLLTVPLVFTSATVAAS